MRKRKPSLIKNLFMQRKRWSLSILIVSVTSTILNSVGLTLLVPVLFQNFDFKHSQDITSKVTSIFDKYFYWLPTDDKSPWILLFILFLFVAKNALIALRIKLVYALSRRLVLELKQNLLHHIMGKDLHYFYKAGSGSILNHINHNTERAARLLLDTIEFFGMFFQLASYIVVLAFLSWKLCLIVCLFSAPLLAFTRVISNKARSLSIEQSHARSNLAQNLSDLLHGIRFVKLSGREKDHIEWLGNINNEILIKSSKMGFLGNVGQPITELTALCLLLSMVVSLSFLKAQSQISLDGFFTYLLILSRAMPLFTQLTNRRVELANNAGAVSELEKVLEDKSFQAPHTGGKAIGRIRKNILVDNVSFAYPETNKNVLNSISFEIKQGESIAIVGPSGSGKSTMIDLLLGFYLPSSGNILIDNEDYRNYSLKSYRSKVGIVPQEVILFFSTVRENLTYMCPTATEIEIWRALEQADMADFVSQLPNGLDTEIGEKGVMLSGGQKQRLSIARALLQKPELLIFDEATSSLDSISETKIVDSIKQASAGRTTITIAHRLATILHCSRVILIEHGWMVEEGNIQQLMSRSSRFRKYAEAQNLKLSA